MRRLLLLDSRRLGWVVLAAAVPLLLLALPGPATAQSRTLTETFDSDEYRGVVLDVKVAEVDVEGSSGDEIVLAVRVACEWDDPEDCRDRVDDIEIVSSDWNGDLYLEIEGLGFWGSRGVHLDIDLTLPARMPFSLELGVGEVTISDLGGDVSVDLGVGEIDITMDASAVKSVTLDNGIGESRLRYPDGKQDVSGILGGTEVFWDLGPGTHDVKVELNVGEIRVALR